MFPLEILEIRLDFLHVLFNVARRHEVFPRLDTFLLIVYAYQHDGNLGSQGDVIEPLFPFRVGRASAFRGDGQVKRIAFLDSFYQLVHHGRTLVAVYGNPSHLPEQDAQREEEPFLLHQKARLAAYGRDEQFPDNQVPVGGVRGRADDALLEVGHIHFRFPALQFVVDKPTAG